MNKKNLVIIAVIFFILIGIAIYFLYYPKFTQYYEPNSNNIKQTLNTATIPNNANAKNIAIQNFSFNPSELAVSVGDTVTWANKDSAPHKISGISFISGNLNKGDGFSFTFNSLGTFNYICSLHPLMKGKIIVQ